ncbi:OmpP1/FadL family transporter [Neisseriaceae bacterium ESL0693]|nr:OmpP1/FadL family transporter [Neisseriaceae bacterium ESL0693]
MLLALLGSVSCFASGYHLGLQSVRAVATANANVAEAAEAATIATNPAGLSQLTGTQSNQHLFLVQPEIRYQHARGQFTDHSSVQGTQQGSLTPKWQAIPQWYGAHQLNDQWHVGLGLYVPYAARTRDDSHSVLRYNVNSTHVKSLDINPAIAYTINEQHAIGVGFIGQYMEAALQKYADFTPVGAAISGQPSHVIHQQPGAFDVKAQVKGHDWGYGFNAGWLWNVSPQLRLGVSYRSKINHTLSGHATWQPTGQQAINILPALVHSGYRAKEQAFVPLTTPEVWSVHGQWQPTPQWKLFSHASWTRSDRLKYLDIQFENDKVINPATGQTAHVSRIGTHWRNTYNLAIGTAYQYNNKLQWLAGVGYDQSPVSNNRHRLPTLPDGNRWLFGTGVQYQYDKYNSINASYAYLHIQQTSMHQQDQGEHVSSHTLAQANYRAHAHIMGFSYNHRF